MLKRRREAKSPNRHRMRAVLEDFIDDINDTGGVSIDRMGLARPMGDPDWIDLGQTYLRACGVLSIKPKKFKTARGEFD